MSAGRQHRGSAHRQLVLGHRVFQARVTSGIPREGDSDRGARPSGNRGGQVTGAAAIANRRESPRPNCTRRVRRAGRVATIILACAAWRPADVVADKLYWTQRPIVDRVQRANLDGTQVEPLVEWPVIDEPISVQVDPFSGYVYWAQLLGDRVVRADASGANVVTILEWPDVDDATAIALDPIGWKMYWAQTFDDRILRCDLNGANIQTVLEWPTVNNPTALVLDIAASKVYWAQSGTGGDDRIQRANLDGTNVEVLVQWPEVDDPVGIALDTSNGKLYWVQSLLDGGLMRADPTGANVESLLEWPIVNEPVALALGVNDGKIYWAQAYESRIRRANGDGTAAETLLSWPTSDTPSALTIVPDALGTCPSPVVESAGPRYLKVTIPPSAGPMAIHVNADPSDGVLGCRSGYVQANCQGGSAAGQVCTTNAECPGGLCNTTGMVAANPVFRTSTAWGSVAVRADWIAPSARVEVQVVCGQGATASASPVVSGTTWKWGDVNNNGAVNFSDVTRVVSGFQGGFSGSLTLESVDITGANCLPNRVVNFQDVSSTVAAFQSKPFVPCSTCP